MTAREKIIEVQQSTGFRAQKRAAVLKSLEVVQSNSKGDRRNLYGWLAGFWEGEGCISINKGYDNYGSAKVSSYGLVISLGNTEKESLDIFCDAFGGHISLMKRYLGNRQAWVWAVQSMKAAKALKRLLPHFRVQCKIDQAKLGILFQQRKELWKSRNGKGEIVSEQESLFREWVHERMKLLKRDNPLTSEDWQLINNYCRSAHEMRI